MVLPIRREVGHRTQPWSGQGRVRMDSRFHMSLRASRVSGADGLEEHWGFEGQRREHRETSGRERMQVQRPQERG